MTQNQARQPGVFDQAFLTGVPDVTEVLLVRHGQQYVPDYANGPVGDQFDPPLSDRGRQQARLVGERFSIENIDRVYASPLHRALDTGREIARHHRLEPIIIDDLREVEIFRDIPADKPVREVLGESLLLGIRERMLHEKSWDVYPKSESSFEFRRRVVNAIEGIIAESRSPATVASSTPTSPTLSARATTCSSARRTPRSALLRRDMGCERCTRSTTHTTCSPRRGSSSAISRRD
jgi:broad specificity phosphatase PhoE